MNETFDDVMMSCQTGVLTNIIIMFGDKIFVDDDKLIKTEISYLGS